MTISWGSVQQDKKVGIQQIQQMFNMDKDQTILQTPLTDTEEGEMTITLMEAKDNLNL